jgi:hypothetical protein
MIFGMFVLFELGIGGMGWATRRRLDGSLGGDDVVWVLVAIVVHGGLGWEKAFHESALDSGMSPRCTVEALK